ncbi:lytic transglycosylase domain-containing protein [Pectinatus sottacetonis]|uniref:lytic transglycosylase domain-containing protein n=1 Tax=Pectinatus sottacetonis TaxID=1002795 RepID=UPI001E5841BF|nr:lytic transglycosylase domain-containing protein [Pectinatus sottacetonis]
MQMHNMASVTKVDSVSSDVNRVRQRIKEIENKFNINFTSVNANFSNIYKQKINNSNNIKNEQLFSNTTTGKGDNTSNTIKSDKADINNYIAKAAQKYNVDPKLLSAIAKTESNYNANAKSSAGAIGIMQLMPNTAADLGVANPYDAEQNIDGGAKYLRQLLNDFNGNVSDAVAAYNAGPQAVKRYKGTPPYNETKNYVKHVLDLYQ